MLGQIVAIYNEFFACAKDPGGAAPLAVFMFGVAAEWVAGMSDVESAVFHLKDVDIDGHVGGPSDQKAALRFLGPP